MFRKDLRNNTSYTKPDDQATPAFDDPTETNVFTALQPYNPPSRKS